MLGELQKLLRREQKEEIDAPVAILRHKRSYKKWNCGNCSHAYFYGVIKCPVCESGNITQTIHELDQDYKDVVEVVG